MGKKNGVLWAIGAYIIWGLLPIYWKTIGNVPSSEILVSRIVWAFIFTLLLVLLMKNGRYLMEDMKALWKTQRDFWSLFTASALMSGNWFLYIWAVNHDFIVQTSLGYYINPLISVLIGMLFLKEKLSRMQQVAFLLATIGVVLLTISYGTIPWISFALAISFAIYGFFKKKIKLDALRGLTIETLFITPFALGYYIWLLMSDRAVFQQGDIKTDVLLILSGAATAIPLVLFAKGAQKLPLFMVGFLQYIAPTLMLFLGVIVYGEAFGKADLFSFMFIWIALILFTVSKLVEVINIKKPSKLRRF